MFGCCCIRSLASLSCVPPLLPLPHCLVSPNCFLCHCAAAAARCHSQGPLFSRGRCLAHAMMHGVPLPFLVPDCLQATSTPHTRVANQRQAQLFQRLTNQQLYPASFPHVAWLVNGSQDVTKMVMAGTHLGMKNCNFQMQNYVFKRRPDGIHVLNIHKTWEKVVLAARIIAAIENPKDVCVISGCKAGQRAVLKFASMVGATAMAGRYTPGTFTNQIQKRFTECRLLIVTDPQVGSRWGVRIVPTRRASLWPGLRPGLRPGLLRPGLRIPSYSSSSPLNLCPSPSAVPSMCTSQCTRFGLIPTPPPTLIRFDGITHCFRTLMGIPLHSAPCGVPHALTLDPSPTG